MALQKSSTFLDLGNEMVVLPHSDFSLAPNKLVFNKSEYLLTAILISAESLVVALSTMEGDKHTYKVAKYSLKDWHKISEAKT